METEEVAVVNATFSLVLKILLYFQRINPRTTQHFLQCKFDLEGSEKISLVPGKLLLCFSTGACFQGLKELEMLVDRMKLASHANHYTVCFFYKRLLFMHAEKFGLYYSTEICGRLF